MGGISIGWRGRETQERLLGYALILPSLALVAGLVLYPLVFNIWLSLFDKHAFLPIETFVGLGNFWELARDREFWSSLSNGVIYALATTVLQLIMGIGSGLVLHEAFAGRNIARGAILFPYMVPTIVVTIVWRWMLNEQYGFVNAGLQWLGIIDQPIEFLGPALLMATVIWVSVWQFFPFVTLAVLGRLQTIPAELYEAAAVDGAGAVRRFLHVTVPQLREVLIVVVLLRGIWMFTKFDTVWLLTGLEASGRYVQTLPIMTYLKTFASMQAGLGAATGVVMLMLQVVVVVAYLQLMPVREEET
jgi:multiple sugar transport system permease protein